MKRNRAAGDDFDNTMISQLKERVVQLERQITIKVGNIKVRVDAIGYVENADGTRTLEIYEFKASESAPLTKNQRQALHLIPDKGGVVVGKGKGCFTRGVEIPPGAVVKIIRRKAGGSWYVSSRFG